MAVLRNCLELCCSPNTVSKFVRIFPKAALFFLILHIIIMIFTVIGYHKKSKEPVVTEIKSAFPQEPIDDLGAVPVHIPKGFKIPRALGHKTTDLDGKKKKVYLDNNIEGDKFKLLDD